LSTPRLIFPETTARSLQSSQRLSRFSDRPDRLVVSGRGVSMTVVPNLQAPILDFLIRRTL
jgi:hypothetical protein